MSDHEPKFPYIYQAYGIQRPQWWNEGRIYGVGHPDWHVEIKGLTKDEATRVLAAISNVPMGHAHTHAAGQTECEWCGVGRRADK